MLTPVSSQTLRDEVQEIRTQLDKIKADVLDASMMQEQMEGDRFQEVMDVSINCITPLYVRFTLADPTPQLASDVLRVVGGKSGQNLPMSRWDPTHIGQMVHNAYIRVGWYGEGVLFITTPSERQLHCTRSAPDRPAASGNSKHAEYWPTTSRWSPDEAPTADAESGTYSHWLTRQHRGTIGASDRLM